MARAGEDDLRAIIDADPDINVSPFIEVATILVDKVEECAIERGLTLGDDQLRSIEIYLAAHFYSGRDPIYKKKRTERAEAEFMPPDYLELAKLLDTSGCLDALASGNRAQAYWLGKAPSAQIDYEDRD